MNSFGNKFCFTSFGESHGRAIGGVLDGVPSQIEIDLPLIRQELLRRSGSGGEMAGLCIKGSSKRARNENDEIEWLSGVIEKEGKIITLGTPIAFLIRNTDCRSSDYDYLKNSFRPAHADFAYEARYGIRDYRGGGRASARETAARVVAGNIARQILTTKGITIRAEVVQIGPETDPNKFKQLIETTKTKGDSIGGIIRCKVSGLKAGIGEPIFDKLQAHLAFAIMSINACKGFDYGTGFEQVELKGSEANQITGGITGGISDGTTLSFRCVFKPTPSISKEQTLKDGTTLKIRGRHDVCIALRAAPIVEAMTALVLANFL